MKYWVFFLAIAANTFQAVNACGSSGSTANKDVENICEIPVDNECTPVDVPYEEKCKEKEHYSHSYDKKRQVLCKKVDKILKTKEWKSFKTVADIKEAAKCIEKVREEIHEHCESTKAARKANKLNCPKNNKKALDQLEEAVGLELPVLDVIYERRSPINYDSEREISPLIVTTMFEAARWAPSWENAQPWKFSYVSKKINPKLWNSVLDNIFKVDRSWAKSAPAFIVATTRKDLLGKPNPFAKYDLGQAVSYLTVQAFHQEVFIHQIAGVDTEAVAEKFNVSEEFEAVLVMAVGYIGEEPTKPIRVRKPLYEVFTIGKFDE